MLLIIIHADHIFLDRTNFRKLLGLVILFCVSLALAAPRYKAWSNTDFAMIQYQNQFGKRLSVSCSTLQGMYKVVSVHSNMEADRSWGWECRDVINSGNETGCSISHYTNELNLPMIFMCPANKYIAGVDSYFSTEHGDRRWRFICCGIADRLTVSCRQTGFVNDFDGLMNFEANQWEVINGVFSLYDNSTE